MIWRKSKTSQHNGTSPIRIREGYRAEIAIIGGGMHGEGGVIDYSKNWHPSPPPNPIDTFNSKENRQYSPLCNFVLSTLCKKIN